MKPSGLNPGSPSLGASAGSTVNAITSCRVYSMETYCGGLKEAQLAHGLGGDAAGGEVGNAAGIEFKTHVGDVYLLAQDRQATPGLLLPANQRTRARRRGRGSSSRERRRRRAKRSEDAETVHLEEHGLGEQRDGGTHGRVETLEVTDHADARGTLRRAISSSASASEGASVFR